MSLWIYLEGDTEEVDCTCPNCWHSHKAEQTEVFYESNITHNLRNMAQMAEIGYAIWEPERAGVGKASDLAPLLTEGIQKMVDDPEFYEQYSAENGWGTYEQFMPWIRELLAACVLYPDAKIRVSR